jgi:hypothetical protein
MAKSFFQCVSCGARTAYVYIPWADPGGGGGGGGGALKKNAPSGGRREKCWGISCEKSRFYAKKNIIL